MTYSINGRIKITDLHVAVNAGHVEANAMKAKEDLDAAVGKFNKKAANVDAAVRA